MEIQMKFKELNQWSLVQEIRWKAIVTKFPEIQIVLKVFKIGLKGYTILSQEAITWYQAIKTKSQTTQIIQ